MYELKKNHLKVGLKGQPPIIDGELHQSVKLDDCFWNIGNGYPIRQVLGKSKMVLGFFEGIPTMLKGEVAMFILFFDILTQLPGMNILFDIVKGKGPVVCSTLRTAADVDKVREFCPHEAVPYVGEALTILRAEDREEDGATTFFCVATVLMVVLKPKEATNNFEGAAY